MIKTLLSYVKQYKWVSVLTPVAMLLEVVAELLIPYLLGSIIDNGIKKGDMNYIYTMGIYMVLLALFGLMCGIAGGVFGSRSSTGFAKNLRKGMFHAIQGYSFSSIDKFSTASLVTRITTDVSNIQMAYQMILRIGMRAPASLLVALVLAFRVNSKIASIYLVVVIALGIALMLIVSRAMKYFNDAFPKYDQLNASVQENVSAIRVVKAFVREDHEKKKFVNASNNIYKMFVKAEGIVAYNNPVQTISIYTCILSICFFGAQMIVSSNETLLTTGELTSLLSYCMSILMNLMMLSMIFVMLTMSMASARRVCEVLNEQSDLKNPENPIYDVKDGSVSFKDVTFRYHKTSEAPVLSNINLDIKSGETIGIIGGTGSAKTSLINLISRLYDVNEGSVSVGGEDVRRYDMESLRNQVSVVLQKNILFSGTIYDNLRWGNPDATDEECKKACSLACADEFIERFPDGYNTYITQGGTNVSGGQKQRLCIARALLKKPKILILDDSTSAVDTATDAKIRSAFANEIPNTTKIIIAQRISSVQNADRIIVMEDGKINGIGTHEQLLENNEIYRFVYQSQTSGDEGDFDEGGVQ